MKKRAWKREWTFKEGGKDEKVYTDKKYPIRWYLTEVKLKDGTTHKGHILSAILYVDDSGSDGAKRFFLTRHEKGTPGQELDDLMYVKSITFSDKEIDTWSGKILGDLDIKAKKKDVSIRAFGVETGEFKDGLIKEDGTFEMTGLRAGSYDVLIETPAIVYVGFTWPKKVNLLKPKLTEADKEKLKKDILQLADYFNEREFISIIGRGDHARAIVRKVRTKGHSEGQRDHERIAIFYMQKAGDTWRLLRQIPITRQSSKKGGTYIRKKD